MEKMSVSPFTTGRTSESYYTGNWPFTSIGDDNQERCLRGTRNVCLQKYEGFGERASSIRSDRRYSEEGRAEKIRQEAEETLRDINSTVRERTASYRARVQQYNVEITRAMPAAPDPALAQEIRTYVRALPDGQRSSFVQTRLDDAQLVGAIINAPPYLSGLHEEIFTLIQKRVAGAYAPQKIGELERLVGMLASVDQCVNAIRKALAKTADIPLPSEIEVDPPA
jgi:hypothetical protein